MARHFVDTSALVKLYRNESLTAAVEACVAPNDTLVIGGIACLEFQSAFYGLVRQNLIAQSHAQQRISLLRQDLPNFVVISLTQALVASAEVLIDRFGVSEGLRPGDALHLACALEAHGQAPLDSVLTTDAILSRCMLSVGLVVKP
ncbi:MAG TPA: type II toxin-antitoxin system VapC family toxin [Verrucomicrobiae bacterium]|nr:type II toxin-antitoxin system VapC family toxin [Verrucomicrobiae bacterium]